MSIATINDGKLIMKIDGEQAVRRCAHYHTIFKDYLTSL